MSSNNIIIFSDNLITPPQLEWLRDMGQEGVDWTIETLYWPGTSTVQSEILYLLDESLSSLVRMKFEQ